MKKYSIKEIGLININGIFLAGVLDEEKSSFELLDSNQVLNFSTESVVQKTDEYLQYKGENTEKVTLPTKASVDFVEVEGQKYGIKRLWRFDKIIKGEPELSSSSIDTLRNFLKTKKEDALQYTDPAGFTIELSPEQISLDEKKIYSAKDLIKLADQVTANEYNLVKEQENNLTL